MRTPLHCFSFSLSPSPLSLFRSFPYTFFLCPPINFFFLLSLSPSASVSLCISLFLSSPFLPPSVSFLRLSSNRFMSPLPCFWSFFVPSSVFLPLSASFFLSFSSLPLHPFLLSRKCIVPTVAAERQPGGFRRHIRERGGGDTPWQARLRQFSKRRAGGSCSNKRDLPRQTTATFRGSRALKHRAPGARGTHHLTLRQRHSARAGTPARRTCIHWTACLSLSSLHLFFPRVSGVGSRLISKGRFFFKFLETLPLDYSGRRIMADGWG